MKTNFGKWYPYDPYQGLALGTQLTNYVFNDIDFNAYSKRELKRVLDRYEIHHPAFYRKNVIAVTVFHEFMTVGDKIEN